MKLIYVIKQDIHMYFAHSRPTDRTDWAEIFCGLSWVADMYYRLNKFFFSRATPGPSAGC